VLRDEKGEIHTVRYEAVNAMLLNEFLKEHQRVEAGVKTNAEQDKRIEAQEETIRAQALAIEEQRKANAEQERKIRALTSSLAEVTLRIEKMAQRMEETKAPAVPKVVHRNPASF